MRKNIFMLIIYGFIFAIGLIIIKNSINLGNHEASSFLRGNGGMDTSTYLIYLEQSMTNHRFIGTILSILGGLGLIKNTNIKS